MHDDYKQLDLAQLATVPPNGGVTLEPCPICASEAQLWQYSESETSPRKLLVMCSHGEVIGPQDGLVNEGCPFYMPKDGHYRETIRDAIRYWNELAKAITALRSENARGVNPSVAAEFDRMTDRARDRLTQDLATAITVLDRHGFADVAKRLAEYSGSLWADSPGVMGTSNDQQDFNSGSAA